MNANQAIAATLDTSNFVLNSYFSDLTDEELISTPAEGCNPLAWQLGHLITSECRMLDMLVPGSAPELPEGFADKHSKEQSGNLDLANYYTKQEYQDLFEKVHTASKAALEKVTEDELDAPAPEAFRQLFPTTGAVWILLAMHGMMHAGQFVPVRRKLGKPVVI
ncbi:DinB family protein [Aeoliella sp. ICT_H6.2]|uniref:DinB family protein n=1 Tax=Aeoliella straminimaris TaxID=2954799 RepID=A0A9X2JFN1_9BACT|nr:DinB family protein [Aeoliella straminimaris]MCO6043467.1 DinB family protein [Aeoliella straminimaris]